MGKGQTLHHDWTLGDRQEASCHGVVRVAYVRRLQDGSRTWDAIGEFCDACQTFWPGERRARRRQPTEEHRLSPTASQAPEPPALGRVGRNDPCPCGSGQKFKRCHGA
jgi:hypothetical protein